MLQFCKNRLKIERNFQHCHLCWYKIICKVSIKSQFLSLVIMKILVLVSVSILTPNTSLALIILHLKPKIVKVLAKTWFIKTNLQNKILNF